MLSILLQDRLQASIDAAAGALGVAPFDTPAARATFFDLLADVQGVPLPRPAIYSPPIAVAEIDAAMTRWMMDKRLLSEAEVMDERHCVRGGDFEAACGRIPLALERLSLAGNEYRALVERCINRIVLLKLDDQDGGSVSAAIGFMYLAPKADWSDDYMGEMLLHEATHNRLFLLDMVEGLFPDLDALNLDDALALSSIRQVMRPYDKAFHSSCVSYLLIGYHRDLGNQRRAHALRGPLVNSLRDLKRCYAECSRKGIAVATGLADSIVDEMIETIV